MGLKHTAAASLIILAGLSACNREATGQVAAVVNDEEITLQEVNAEIAALQIPDTADKKAVQQQAIQRIIERRLLAQAAVDDGIDSSQDYLIRERQLRDSLLVQLLGERVERTTKPPEPAELDRYIAENPGLFKDRKIFSVEQNTVSYAGRPEDAQPVRSRSLDGSSREPFGRDGDRISSRRRSN